MQLTTVDDVRQAAERVRGTVLHTPLVDVSVPAGRPLWLKAENLQVTGSFKLRGALNCLADLPATVRRRGVITYSSGNHARAVAFAARILGVPATVVMPTTAPDNKVSGARRDGAEVLFAGTTSLERRACAEQMADARGLSMIPPFDHPRIIAGQGTIGAEILQDRPGPAGVYVPVGGGGLIAGVSAVVKTAAAGMRVIGVEPVGAAAMQGSLAAGRTVTLKRVASVADGLLPVRPGDLTFAHARAYVDEVITVDDTAIEQAMVWLLEHAKLVAEPSGAAAVAACLARPAGDTAPAVAVVSGGNIAPAALAALMSRTR